LYEDRNNDHSMENAMKIIRLLLLSLFPLLSAVSGLAAEENVPAYTNRDIERYGNTADSSSYPAADMKSGRGKDRRQLRERNEQEYWCANASKIRKRVETGKKSVKELEDGAEAAKRSGDNQKEQKLKIKLKKTKDRLMSDEKELNDLEGRAHRKGVPPGWLRCQFE